MITVKIYHGCLKRYKNRERMLVDSEIYQRRLMPTSEPFQKELRNTYRMQTKRSTKKRQLIHGPIKYADKFTNY